MRATRTVPQTYSVRRPRARKKRAATSADSVLPIRFPRCGVALLYGKADVRRIFLSPLTGSTGVWGVAIWVVLDVVLNRIEHEG
jgi:hypothetical protein